MKRLLQRDKYHIVMIILLSMFLFRVVGLDKDLPGFGVTFYQPIDEGIYSRMALNLYNAGNLYRIGPYEQETSETFRANIIGNLGQFFCMKVFGDNYYGFRIFYTFLSFAVISFAYMIAKKLLCNRPEQKKFMVILLLFLLVDFSFLVASRVVENTICRTLINGVCLYLMLNDKISERMKYFVLGFLTVCSVFLVYFSNVFLLVPLGLLFFNAVCRRDWKKARCILCNTLLGSLAGLGLAEIYYWWVWGSGAFVNFFHSIFDFSYRVVTAGNTGEVKYAIESYFRNAANFWGANIFWFDFLFLFLGILSFLCNIVTAVRENDEKLLYIVGGIGSFFLQSVLAEDYILRKCLAVYLFLIASIIYFYVNIKKKKIGRTFLNGITILSIFWSLLVIINAFIIRYENRYLADYDKIDLAVWFYGTALQFLAIFAVFIGGKYASICRISAGMAVCGMLIVNLFFAGKYVYFRDSFREKEVMMEIGKECGDGYVLGGNAHAYTLYNDVKAVCNYEHEIEYMSQINCMLDYAHPDTLIYYILPYVMQTEESVLKIEHLLERSLKTMGDCKSIALFSIKDDYRERMSKK